MAKKKAAKKAAKKVRASEIDATSLNPLPPQAAPGGAAAASKPKKRSGVSNEPLSFEQRLYNAQDAITLQEARLDYHNNHVLAAKHEIKAQNEEIKKIIDEQRNGAQGDLFSSAESNADGPAAAAPSPVSRAPERPAPGGGASQPAKSAIPAEWEKSPVSILCEYGMPNSVVGALTKGKIHSVGDLEKFLENGNPIDALEGIAAKSGASIISAAAAFSKARQGK